MMNQQTRRLSKMPEEVRAEISPWFIEKNAIQEETTETIKKIRQNRKVHKQQTEGRSFPLIFPLQNPIHDASGFICK